MTCPPHTDWVAFAAVVGLFVMITAMIMKSKN